MEAMSIGLFSAKEYREYKQNNSDRVENSAMLVTLLPDFKEHDFI